MVTVNVTADAYVISTDATGNYGDNEFAAVGTTSSGIVRRTWYKVDMDAITGPVESAKLFVYVYSVSGNMGLNYRAESGDADWSSSTLTYGSQPAFGTVVSPVTNPPASAGAWMEVDITDIVNNSLDTDTNYGFVVKRDSESSTESRVTTRTLEYTTTPAEQPYIEVEFAAPSGFPAGVATASAAMPDPTVSTQQFGESTETLEASVTSSGDRRRDGTGAVSTSLAMGLSATHILFKFPSVEMMGDGSARLYFSWAATNGGGTRTFRAERITSTWEEGNTTYPTVTVGASESITRTLTLSSRRDYIDVTDIVGAWGDGEPNHGIALYITASDMAPGGDHTLRMREWSTEADRPMLVVSETTTSNLQPGGPMLADATAVDVAFAGQPVIPADVTADVATAAVEFPEPSVAAFQHVDHQAEPATAQAIAGDATGTGVILPDFTGSADPMLASASLPAPAVDAETPAYAVATPATASAEMGDVAFSNQTDVSVGTSPAQAYAVGPLTAYIEGQDPFYQYISSLEPYVWFRMNETEGDPVQRGSRDPLIPNVWNTSQDDYELVGPRYIGDPERGLIETEMFGRRYVNFVGGQNITLPVGRGAQGNLYSYYASSTNLTATVTVITFRTSDPEQVILSGSTFGYRSGSTTLRLEGGYPTLVDSRYNDTDERYARVGNTRIDDGEWHQLVVSDDILMIDGNLDMYRNTGWGYLTPLNIGGTTAQSRTIEVMEFVSLTNTGTPETPETVSPTVGGEEGLEATRIIRKYAVKRFQKLWYAWIGADPIEAAPATARAEVTQGTKGKGNIKEVLVLTWPQTYLVTRDGGLWRETGIGHPSYYTEPEGEQWFAQRVGAYFADYRVTKVNMAQNLRHPVTDELRPFDFGTDIDVSYYDLVMFDGYPNKDIGRSPITILPKGGWDHEDHLAWEFIMDSFREHVIDEGIPVLINHPRYAYDLGLAETVDYVPMMEGSPTGGRRDLYVEDILIKQFELLKKTSGRGFFNWHKLDHVQIANEIPGLTDLFEDDVHPSVWERLAAYYDEGWTPWEDGAWNYETIGRPLQPGDEIAFQPRGPAQTSDEGAQYPRNTYVWGVPEGRHVGIAITKGQGRIYQGGGQWADAPTKGWTHSFIVPEGTEVDGRPIPGRIYVDFIFNLGGQWQQAYGGAGSVTEQNAADFSLDNAVLSHFYNHPAYRDGVIKPSNQFDVDTSQAYSGSFMLTYTQTYASGIVVTRSVRRINPTHETFPEFAGERLPLFERGLFWLRNEVPVDDTIGEGDVRVRPLTVTGSAEMPEPTVTAGRSTTVGVQPMRATARLRAPLEADVSDVNEPVLPMQASARMVTPAETQGVMEAHAEMPDPAVRGGGTGLLVYLHRPRATVQVRQ